jgi:hypothetical protein
MNDANNTSKSQNKNFDDFLLMDIHGRNHRFRRTRNGKGYFDILDCYPLTDGRVPGLDGVLPDAIYFTNEEVADFITQAEQRQARLERAESALRERIDFRNAWARKSKRKLSLQKKEVVK